MWITLDFSAKTQIFGQQNHAYEYKSTSYTHELPLFWGNGFSLITHLYNTTTISMLEYGIHPVCDIVNHTKTEAIQLGHDLPQLPFTQLK